VSAEMRELQPVLVVGLPGLEKRLFRQDLFQCHPAVQCLRKNQLEHSSVNWPHCVTNKSVDGIASSGHSTISASECSCSLELSCTKSGLVHDRRVDVVRSTGFEK
jgi:hypothetical protein